LLQQLCCILMSSQLCTVGRSNMQLKQSFSNNFGRCRPVLVIFFTLAFSIELWRKMDLNLQCCQVYHKNRWYIFIADSVVAYVLCSVYSSCHCVIGFLLMLASSCIVQLTVRLCHELCKACDLVIINVIDAACLTDFVMGEGWSSGLHCWAACTRSHV